MSQIVDYTNTTNSVITIGSYTFPALGEIVFNDGIGDPLLDAEVGFALVKRIDGVDSGDLSIARWKDSTGAVLVKPDGTEVTPGGGGGGGGTWDTLSGKPAVIAAGATASAARSVIDVIDTTGSNFRITKVFPAIGSVGAAQFLTPVTIGTPIGSSTTNWTAGQLRYCLGGAHLGSVAQLQADGSWVIIFDGPSNDNYCNIYVNTVSGATQVFTKVNNVVTTTRGTVGTSDVYATGSTGFITTLTSVLGGLSSLTLPIKTSYTDAINYLYARQKAVGEVSMFAGTTAPVRHKMCDGSALNRGTYAELFTLIGTTYGAGDGVNTFNLPDLRKTVPVHSGKRTTEVGGIVTTIGQRYGLIDSTDSAVKLSDTSAGDNEVQALVMNYIIYTGIDV